MMRKIYPCVAGLAFSQALVLLAGCSSGGVAASGETRQSRQQSGYAKGLEGMRVGARLEMLAEREAINPSEPSRVIADRIMEGRLVELEDGSEAHARAHRSLEDVVAGVLEGISPVEVDEMPLLPQIAKGYVRARAMMLNDDAAGAVEIFEQLHEVSPESSEILVGLGDAHLRAGSRTLAVEAYLRAVELGDRTVRALVYGAMGSTGDSERVIELGAMVWGMEDSNDRAGRLLGGVMLGQALIAEGLYGAGADVMAQAMGMLDAQTARSQMYRRELVQLYTKRAEQYASLGDAWMVLERTDRAIEFYTLAGELVTSEPQTLMSRRMAAEFLGGHSAMGVMTLLEWIDANPGNDSLGFYELAGVASEHELVGGMLVESLNERLEDRSLPVSHRRAVLGLVLSLAEDGGQGLDILGGVEPEVVSPVACAMVLDMFNGAERVDAVVELTERSPSIGAMVVPAMIRLDGRALELLALVQGNSEAAGLVRCLITLDLQRPDLLESLDGMSIGELDFAGLSTSWLIAHGRAAAMAGRWELADGLFDECDLREASMDGAERFFFADSLVTANQADRAVGIVERRTAAPNATAADWLVSTRIALKVGDLEKALEGLTRAIDLDPYDEAIYEQLITLRGPNGAFADVEELRTVTRALGQRLPASALVSLIRAHELAGAGAGSDDPAMAGQAGALLVQSERLLLNVHSQHPWREIGTDLLLSIWATQSSRGDIVALRRGIGWIDGELAKMPGSVALAGAKARMMVLTGDEIGAEGYLDGVYERMPSRQVGRLHEGLIRSDADRREEADQIALSRLDGLVSIDDCLERLERAGGAGLLGDYEAGLLVPSDGDWEFGVGQSLRIVRVLGAMAQNSVDGEGADLLLELVERTRDKSVEGAGPNGINPLESLDLIEIVVRPSGSTFSMEDFESLIRGQYEEPGGGELVTVAVQSLMRSRSAGEAIELISRLTITNDGMLDEIRVADLSSLIGQIGTAGDIETAIERLDLAGLMIEARDSVVGSLGTLREESMAGVADPDGVAADFAYSIAVVASFYQRDAEATGMYRVALSYAPGHAWANNDLGYHMVEGGGDLVEAERLLLIAYEAEPGTASITDSLAWARYAMGIVDDELDADGNVIRRGARGLLEEALAFEEGPDNATIHDHLGDALWMVGEFDKALAAWLDAESRLRQRQTELSNQANVNTAALDEIRSELSKIRFKIADGESGRVPTVAPNTVELPVPDPSEVSDEEPSDIVNEIDPTK